MEEQSAVKHILEKVSQLVYGKCSDEQPQTILTKTMAK
jgi:hypothetical protein